MPNPAAEEYAKIVNALRTAVGSPETANPTLLADDAAQYSEACAEVNQRIREAHDLKAKGLRVEAIQHSMVEPDALECIEVLDFPERNEWRELAQFWRFPPPPELELPMATALDEAHGALEVLKPLLVKDRFLNLSRAPIEERAMVLRQLLATDQDLQSKENWKFRIMQIEAVRLKEIEADMDAAFERRDTTRVDQLYKELHEQQWISPIPPDLPQKVAQYRAQLQTEAVIDLLERLLPDWEAARNSGNVERGELCRKKWREYFPQSGLTVNDPLSLRAQPLLTWMDNSDVNAEVRQEIIGFRRELNKLLDHQADPSEIDAAAAKIERLGGELTGDVRARIKQAHDHKAKGQHYRMIAIIVGAIILVFFMLGMFGLLIYFDTQSRQDIDGSGEFKIVQKSLYQPLLLAESSRVGPADILEFAEIRNRE